MMGYKVYKYGAPVSSIHSACIAHSQFYRDRDSRRRYLPDRTIVSDLTVSHPSTKTWRNKVVKSGVHVVGDARAAEKTSKYQAMAAQHDKEFHAIVLYTYGGLHHSSSTSRPPRLLSDSLYQPTPSLLLLLPRAAHLRME